MDTRPPYFSAIILILIGLVLTGGGVYLAVLGGSLYYVIAGIAVLLSGVLYWRGNIWGERLYALMLIGTLLWGHMESDGNPWALLARVFAPAVLGLWLAMPWVRNGLRDVTDASPVRSPAGIVSAASLLVLVVLFVQFTAANSPDVPPTPLTAAQKEPAPADTDWTSYGADSRGNRYAPLTQINTENVDKLQIAWEHRSGDMPTPRNLAEATPIKVGDTVYTCGSHGLVMALDAVTGKEKWRSAANIDVSGYKFITCRGVAFYQVSAATPATDAAAPAPAAAATEEAESEEHPDATPQPTVAGLCDARVIAAGPGHLLRALDAGTGAPCPDFGQNGVVNLFEGLGSVEPGETSPTSTPTVVNDLIVLGAMVYDSKSLDLPSGVIRAFDAKTGALRWAWDMGAPDRIGAPAEGETYTRSTPNSWPSFAADAELGLVFVPTGNPQPDFYGVNRRDFDVKYGSSVVALNLTDGRPRWHYQTTRYDLWDYDLPAQPVLIDIPAADGTTRPALVQPTKRGDIFVLDRRDGTPIVPVKEIDVPQAGFMVGEKPSKTQPVSEISLIPDALTEAKMWGATPIDQMLCRIDFKRARYEGLFTPPSLKYTIQFPGSMGSLDWGGVTVNEDEQIIVANSTDFPWFGQQVPRETVKDADNTDWPQRKTPFVLRSGPHLSPLNMPCLQPPWGKLAAIDLKTNKVLWRYVLGTAADNGPFGIRTGLPLLIGPPSLGGAITTRGGLIFIAATLDEYFRAFDLKTGKKLWEVRLPAGAQAMPMTYMAGGKQYVVLTVGGHSGVGTRAGDYTIAWALPDAQK